MSVNSAGDFPRSRLGVTLKNVSFVIGQNEGEISRTVCFLLAERKHHARQDFADP